MGVSFDTFSKLYYSYIASSCKHPKTNVTTMPVTFVCVKVKMGMETEVTNEVEQTQGLSTCHKRTNINDNEHAKGDFSGEVIQGQVGTLEPAMVSYYKTGNLATVTRELTWKACIKCGEPFKVETWRYAKVHFCRKCLGLVTARRGLVMRFSWRSRTRLMRTLNTVDGDCLPVFVTLTYPDSYSHALEPAQWKQDLRVFELRLRRAFPGGCYVWRMETVDRKSGEHIGEIYPHFHLLVYGVSRENLRKWVPTAWYETVGTNDVKHLHAGTQVKCITSRRGVMRYASKALGQVMSGELAKELQTKGEGVGRWWGVAVRKVFKYFQSETNQVEMSDGESVNVIRIFRKLSGAFPRGYRSLTAFLSGKFISERLPEMAVIPMGVKSYPSTGRRWDVPFYQWAYDAGLWKPATGTV